ncbi:sulfurtransferase [Flavobacterium sp. U410]
MMLSPIISASELLKLTATEKKLFIADVSNHKEAKSNYESKHLHGAVFVDLNTQLADIKTDLSNGGRHPLPEIKAFSKTLGQLGISKATHIVIYDDKNGANAAARFWWMLKAVGHEKVQVLDGGIQMAEEQGFTLDNQKVMIEAVEDYPVSHWQLPIASMDEVETISQNKDFLVIDVREESRYQGIAEPIDLVAGHISGAFNVPFVKNLSTNGTFLSPEVLKQQYISVLENRPLENVVVHCGSGVTACHTLLAMDYAGLGIPKLYVGSWSEWSRNEKEIATGTAS